MAFRIGFGYDVHMLEEGHDLVLGGVIINHTKGTIAHSDGDVLMDAICDSILGAAALGDIGRHFPDSDPKYKGISSMILLERVHEILIGSGYQIENIDTTIVLQNPKICPYNEEMRRNISKALKISLEKVSIKATTTEFLGFEGREEGVGAYAVCLISN
jgi:2-C-methyl-D-erythritol 2,4-cyclodiphosphate synthase